MIIAKGEVMKIAIMQSYYFPYIGYWQLIKSLDYVYDYYQYYNEGDQMTCSGRFQQTFCRIFICCNRYDVLIENTKTVMGLLKVIDDKDCDMLLQNVNE